MRSAVQVAFSASLSLSDRIEAEKATWTADSILCYRFCCASCILAMLSVRYIVNAIYYHHIQHLYALKISSFAGRKHEQSFCGRRGLPLAATRSVLQGSKCCHPAPELRRRNVRKPPGCSCRLGKASASKQTSVLQLWDGTR